MCINMGYTITYIGHVSAVYAEHMKHVLSLHVAVCAVELESE